MAFELIISENEKYEKALNKCIKEACNTIKSVVWCVLDTNEKFLKEFAEEIAGTYGEVEFLKELAEDTYVYLELCFQDEEPPKNVDEFMDYIYDNAYDSYPDLIEKWDKAAKEERADMEYDYWYVQGAFDK